ncbi:MAG TPA: C-GCAxxG-C-C family (seleno)protein [Armatimonadota bacterium]|jgi:C_GCAxxG_C_C family probable redox protein
MTTTEQAREYFAGGYNCAQATLAAYAPEFGLDAEAALRLAAALGGGIARRGETCGALLGALLALGLAEGAADPSPEAKQRIYARAGELQRRFEERFGSWRCKELLDCDLSTPEGSQLAREKSFHTTVCPAFVAGAAEILTAMLA